MNAIVLLPRHHNGGFFQQEECCFGKFARWTPALGMHAATWLRHRRGARVAFFPFNVESAEPIALPPADLYVLIFTWGYGLDLEPHVSRWIAEGKNLSLAPNPFGGGDALRAVFGETFDLFAGGQSPFTADLPLAIDAMPDELWPEFRVVTHQVATGCYWHCHYCPWASRRHVNRDPVLAVKELVELLHRVPTAAADRTGNSISIFCNEVNTDQRWLNEFCRLVTPLKITWISDLNIRTATEAQIAMLALAGLREVTLGIEFLEDAMLQRLWKGHTVEQAFGVMGWLQQHGIRYRFSLRSGVGETTDDIARLTANVERMRARGLRPQRISCGPMAEWPGIPWMPKEWPRVNIGSEKFPRWTQRLSDEVKAAWKPLLGRLKQEGLT
jgi:radical SAM superfamily enzyme YgiQ (UPF0313 family)